MSAALPSIVSIPARFAGPPGSANGGYVAGLLARRGAGQPPDGGLGQPGEVTLRQPPPLETRLDLVPDGEGQRLTFGGAVIAEVSAPQDAMEALGPGALEPVEAAVAAAAEPAYRGQRDHPFPGCFVCGTARTRPDGLALRPGPLPDRPDVTACTWTPDASLSLTALYPDEATSSDAARVVPPELAWAALDCPGAWSVDMAGRPLVLGRMAAAVDALPPVGEPCVVVGQLLGQEGRKSWTATALFDADGRLLAHARATWIAVDPARAGRR